MVDYYVTKKQFNEFIAIRNELLDNIYELPTYSIWDLTNNQFATAKNVINAVYTVQYEIDEYGLLDEKNILCAIRMLKKYVDLNEVGLFCFFDEIAEKLTIWLKTLTIEE